MHINYDVPFVANAADDRHCYSASLTMIVGHFVPEVPPLIEVGNRISSKPKGRLAAWPIGAPLWLQRCGFDVTVAFDFDYKAVGERGIEYIRSRYGDEIALWQESNTELPQPNVVRDFLSDVRFERRVPELADIEGALAAKALIAVTVNSSMLNGDDGYVNHSVVVKGITDTGLVLHNPGLPPRPEHHVTFDDFVAAWSYPSDDARYFMSVGRSLDRDLDVGAVMALAKAAEADVMGLG